MGMHMENISLNKNTVILFIFMLIGCQSELSTSEIVNEFYKEASNVENWNDFYNMNIKKRAGYYIFGFYIDSLPSELAHFKIVNKNDKLIISDNVRFYSLMKAKYMIKYNQIEIDNKVISIINVFVTIQFPR